MPDGMFEVPGDRLRELTAEIGQLRAALDRARALAARWRQRTPTAVDTYQEAAGELLDVLDG